MQISQIALLPLIALAACAQLHHDQLPLKYGAQRVTLVDALSANANYSTLLQLLQRARLVPTLNKLSNATLFAPTNEALSGIAWTDDPPDNIQSALRRQLMYHMLNYSLPVLPDESPHLIETLLFPHPKAGHGRPGFPDEGDRADEHSLLGGEGQKLEWSSSMDAGQIRSNDQTARVSGNATKASNGLVLPIDRLLSPPKDITYTLRHHPRLSQIRSLYSEEQLRAYATQANLTLFAPVDEAWQGDAIGELEWKYLRSGFAEKDLMELFENHAAGNRVEYADRLANKHQISTIAGHPLAISTSGKSIKLNDSLIVEGDILASNGVVHLIDKLLLPQGALAMTPEKYLLGLNFTRFVRLIRSAGISELIQSEEPITVLAPSDDVLEAFKQRDWANFPSNGSQELRDLLRYHIIKGKWTARELQDGMLLDTALTTADLKGNAQKIHVSVEKQNSDAKNDKVAFDGASVLEDPIEIGSSVVYKLSQVVDPPRGILETAMADLRLSTFVAAIYAAELDKQLQRTPGVTFMAPVNSAFSSLGLTVSYLLLPSSRTELRKVMRYHAVDKLSYLSDLQTSQRLPTLEGSSMYVEASNISIALRGPTVSGFPASGQLEHANVTDGNVLTTTGTLHVIDQVVLPPTLNISIEKLLKGAKANTMVDLLIKANMTWLLRGDHPPSNFSVTGKKWKRRKKSKVVSTGDHPSYTLLCPLDRAFTRVNLTHYLDNQDALVELLKLHIIPNDPVFPADGRPILLQDQITYESLLSTARGGPSKYGKLAFRAFGDDHFVVGIHNSRGSLTNDWARVVSYGRATPRFETTTLSSNKTKLVYSGGVLTLDSVLEPYQPDWFHRWGWIVVVILLCVVGLGVVLLLSVKLWRSKQEHAAYEALENEEN